MNLAVSFLGHRIYQVYYPVDTILGQASGRSQRIRVRHQGGGFTGMKFQLSWDMIEHPCGGR